MGLFAALTVSASGPVQVFAEIASDRGEAAVREVRLWVDGQEVTGLSSVSAIRISYALPGDFPTGTHAARVSVVDSLGRSHEQSWSFEVSETRPEVVAFFTDRLEVVLDALPRSTRQERVLVSGSSLPEVEIELRRGARVIGRTETSQSGRFSLAVELLHGENELAVAALRPWTGEEGQEQGLRLQRLMTTIVNDEPDPRRIDDQPGRAVRGGPGAPEVPSDRGLPGGAEVSAPRLAEAAPSGQQRGGHDAPDPPEDREFPSDEVDGVVVITKPGSGALLRNGRAAVLGLAPAGWLVTISVNGEPAGSDRANPAGHFTVARVQLVSGDNSLVAEAQEPGTGRRLSSLPVLVHAPDGPQLLSLSTQTRRNETVRNASWRLEGRSLPGAEIEIEVNGRLVLTERAGFDGRFVAQVPLESGLNRVIVEAFDPRSSASVRSRPVLLRRVARPQRGQAPIFREPPLLERPGGLGSGQLGRLQPQR